MRKSRKEVQFKHSITVKARRATFEPMASLEFLDVDRLLRGTHKIEVGYISGGCCPLLVRAVVRKGLVTDLKVEPCGEGLDSPSADLSALFKRARHLLGVRVGRGCVMIESRRTERADE